MQVVHSGSMGEQKELQVVYGQCRSASSAQGQGLSSRLSIWTLMGPVPCLSGTRITKVTEHGPWIKGINLPTLAQMTLMVGRSMKKTTRWLCHSRPLDVHGQEQ